MLLLADGASVGVFSKVEMAPSDARGEDERSFSHSSRRSKRTPRLCSRRWARASREARSSSADTGSPGRGASGESSDAPGGSMPRASAARAGHRELHLRQLMEQKSRCEGNREIKLELAFTLKNTLNTLNDSLNLLRTDSWGPGNPGWPTATPGNHMKRYCGYAGNARTTNTGTLYFRGTIWPRAP